MRHSIENIRKIRLSFLKIIDSLSVEELNRIPPGFNNNVIWNLGHLISSQQSICYTRIGVKPFIDEGFIATYKSGTKPEAPVSAEKVQEMKAIFLQAMDQFWNDFDEGKFPTIYPAWTTGYGNEIQSLDDAVGFFMFHEGLHRGYVMAMKRSL